MLGIFWYLKVGGKKKRSSSEFVWLKKRWHCLVKFSWLHKSQDLQYLNPYETLQDWRSSQIKQFCWNQQKSHNINSFVFHASQIKNQHCQNNVTTTQPVWPVLWIAHLPRHNSQLTPSVSSCNTNLGFDLRPEEKTGRRCVVTRVQPGLSIYSSETGSCVAPC